MHNILIFLGILLFFIGVPASIITTIVFAVKKKRIKKPLICIPISFVLAIICLGVGGYMYGNTDEYKEVEKRQKIEEQQKAEQEKAEKEKQRKEEEKKQKEKEKKEKERQESEKAKKLEEDKKKAKKEEKKSKKKTQSKETPINTPTETPENTPNDHQESKPTAVPAENSTTLYYMDLYENYENYDGQYVTISAPISGADEDSVTIKDGIEGVTGMIDITLLEPRSDLKEGDFITATGRVAGKALGYLHIEEANISQTGEGSAQIYAQQKAEYEAASAQKAAGDAANYKASCQIFDYQDILRNPDSYKDKDCVVSGTVDQIIEGWFDSFTIFITDSAGNKWGCVYTYKEGESHLLEGDGVTIYGKCAGTDTSRTLLGEQVTLPRVDIEYIN